MFIKNLRICWYHDPFNGPQTKQTTGRGQGRLKSPETNPINTSSGSTRVGGGWKIERTH